MMTRLARRAFTLVEILVAVALIGIVVSVVCGSMAATTRSMEAYRDRISVATRSHIGLQQIADSIRCSCDGFRAGSDQVRFITTRPLFEAAADEPGPFDVTVRWDSIGARLVASQAPRHLGGLTDEGAIGIWQPLVDHVRAVQWSFSDGTSWRPGWEGGANHALPLLVRIDMTTQDDHKRPYDLQALVSLVRATRATVTTGDRGRPTQP
jgi:prepilin-type N-terminal cleavage/methylation domain-containing protein